MSLKLKVLVGIIGFSLIGVAVLLTVVLMQGNSKTDTSNNNNETSEIDFVSESGILDNTQSDISGNSITEEVNNLENTPLNVSDYEQVEIFFDQLDGYWTFDNYFFAFTNKDGKHFVEYGLWAASFGVRGDIKDTKFTGENAFSLTIFIPAKSADEMNDARPERTETVYIDISNWKKENRLNVKLDNETIGDNQWHTYEYGGTTLEEAFSDYMFDSVN